jgi:carbon starvation protein
MATLFSKSLTGGSAMALWYHFAIMFEALFILTTLDAGTRVGRFMTQEMAKHVWAPMGRVSWYPSVIVSSAFVVLLWGYFLYQGVTDPLGGVNSLWPLFGISNQLLAAIALCVGTTVIVKMGKARYAFVTILPLCWLAVVTLTAGWVKIFSPDAKLGFLSHARLVADKVTVGALPPGARTAAEAGRMMFNDRLDAAVAGFFMVAVVVIILESARVWLAVVQGRKPATSTEVPFTPRELSRHVALKANQ